MAQFNQQFEKHHIATLRKWADVRGITQARWRSKALQIIVEEAGIEQSSLMDEIISAVDDVRRSAREKQYHFLANMPVQAILLVGMRHMQTYMKDVPPLSTVMDENPGS